MIYNKFCIKNEIVLIDALLSGKVIAYPTDTVFGLGCDPDNFFAVKTLLFMKRRSWKKGLILVGADYSQLFNYIDDTWINKRQLSKVLNSWPGSITWIFPAKYTTPYWLTGRFSSLAVRLISFKPLQRLCLSFGKALISTSANLSGYSPAHTVDDIYRYFGYIPVMNTTFLMNNNCNPSKIREVITGRYVRI